MSGWSRRAVLAAAGAMAAGLGPDATAANVAPLALRRGINVWPWFSLTREYPSPRTDYAWPPFQEGRPIPRAQDLATLREAGFDFIRMPVDPGPFLAFDGARLDALMADLFDAVALAHGAGLNVIVNIQPNEATHYWVSRRMIGEPAAPELARYRSLVERIARGLRGFDQNRVALETVNEPPQECGSPAWPAVQSTLLTVARAAAPDLTLIATGACGSMIRGLDGLDPAPVQALGRVMFTFHFYEPYLFSHQGAPWMREPVYRALNAVPWPASAGSLDRTLAAVRARMAGDTGVSSQARQAAYAETERVLKVYFDARPARPFVDHYLEAVSTWGTDHRIAPQRILMGEFGALRSDARYTASGADDRARYVRDVREAAEANGFPWAFWNLFDGMGIMDEATRALDPAMVDALGLKQPRR